MVDGGTAAADECPVLLAEPGAEVRQIRQSGTMHEGIVAERHGRPYPQAVGEDALAGSRSA